METINRQPFTNLSNNNAFLPSTVIPSTITAKPQHPSSSSSSTSSLTNTENNDSKDHSSTAPLRYPDSLLNLRQQRCFTVQDFDTTTKRLGMGKFGEVFKVREKRSRKVLVIKQVQKQALLDEGVVRQFQREVETHIRLDHPNIIKMYSYFHDEYCCYIALEYANGGSLYESLATLPGKRTTEKIAASYVRQLCSALAYLHKRGVLHRDIKPENLLLFHENNTERLKLADFGWTVAQRHHAQRTTLCGTPEYLPPELCTNNGTERGAYGTAFDMYTVGVLLYEMLVGVSPFAGPTPESNTFEALQERILHGSVRFPSSVIITPTAKNLIIALTNKNPEHRPTALDVLNDPWIIRLAGTTPPDEWDR